MLSLAAAILLAFLVPAWGYQLLKKRVSRFDAAAIAASYGSVSAVTFVTAIQNLEANQMAFCGLMAVGMVVGMVAIMAMVVIMAMVAMESPAIILAVLLAAGASSIVVHAVLRYAIPKANPSRYFGLSRGVTFPLNILFGIPLSTFAARNFLG